MIFTGNPLIIKPGMVFFMHIPIKDYYSFSKNFPDYSILFAWNHKKEIFEKEKNYVQQGGKWINFVPKVTIE